MIVAGPHERTPERATYGDLMVDARLNTSPPRIPMPHLGSYFPPPWN